MVTTGKLSLALRYFVCIFRGHKFAYSDLADRQQLPQCSNGFTEACPTHTVELIAFVIFLARAPCLILLFRALPDQPWLDQIR